MYIFIEYANETHILNTYGSKSLPQLPEQVNPWHSHDHDSSKLLHCLERDFCRTPSCFEYRCSTKAEYRVWPSSKTAFCTFLTFVLPFRWSACRDWATDHIFDMVLSESMRVPMVMFCKKKECFLCVKNDILKHNDVRSPSSNRNCLWCPTWTWSYEVRVQWNYQEMWPISTRVLEHSEQHILVLLRYQDDDL